MNVDPSSDIPIHWREYPAKLPVPYHSSVPMITGGRDGNDTSGKVREGQVVPPHTVKRV